LKQLAQVSARGLRLQSNPASEEVFDMKLRHVLVTMAVAAACSLGLIDARGANSESVNPPRTQQEIMKERYAACRELHGSALKDCMADYVGPPAKNLEKDGAQNTNSVNPSANDAPTDTAQRAAPTK
jgi:hypothetical protein